MERERGHDVWGGYFSIFNDFHRPIHTCTHTWGGYLQGWRYVDNFTSGATSAAIEVVDDMGST